MGESKDNFRTEHADNSDVSREGIFHETESSREISSRPGSSNRLRRCDGSPLRVMERKFGTSTGRDPFAHESQLAK
jgi:hypothetical protein